MKWNRNKNSQNNQTTQSATKAKSTDDTVHFILKLIILAAVIYLFNMFVFQLCFVSGISMKPTLSDKQPVLLQKFNLKKSLHTNDIIVIKAPKLHTTIIKRIIGLPGDQIKIKDGIIYVNNSIFNDVNTFPTIENAGLASETITLGDGQYFVLGDNRNQSIDSRFESVGIIEQSLIIGKVVLP